MPKVVLLFTGKRKSGKDYVVSKLKEMLKPEDCSIIRLSAPLKKQYSIEHNLDYDRLLDSSPYKEAHRLQMIQWGERKRESDPGYFCRLATEEEDKPVWLVSDCRRLSDVEYFKSHCSTGPAHPSCVLVRVSASDEVRRSRGWGWVGGVDDGPSECALDEVSCDYHVINNGIDEQLDMKLKELKNFIEYNNNG
ncbi:PREDICTED: phosphomevalonate kinase-like [Amphimedon queenslandica]|uniref:Phosphomevalonate kinase n=1 Tax=Amphimedon queenslandica TaxID=400682 RepID=A0A1X7SXB3_AMPQE|nr:PREDICTED: phosphomevalonate kinase-like [Amphimedon queenslandica]|eukprot:XP_003391475.1 PREDICTED: phosphomevalonate kinase-like [Amphimedon queenslandica]